MEGEQQTQPQQARKDPVQEIMDMDINSFVPDLSGVDDIMNMDLDKITDVPGMDEIKRILGGQ